MSGSRRRARGAGLLVVLSTLGLCACSTSPDMRDCGYSVTWRGNVYLGLAYALHKPQTEKDVITPNPGRIVGHGFVPTCPGDSDGTAARVYAVPGLSPSLAVMAKTDGGREPILCIRKGNALPKQLLRRP